jgi:hypothetical protein
MKKLFTIKTITLLLGLVFPLILSAQIGSSSHRLPESRMSGNPILKAITSSSVTSTNNYAPGTTMNLNFTVVFASPDQEYMDGFSMTFPTGITPILTGTSSPLATENGCTGITITANAPTGQTITWGNITAPSGCGALTPGTYSFNVNVTIGAGVSGSQTATYTVYGDGYGGTPHTGTGNCIISQSVASDVGVFSVDMIGAYVAGSIIPKATIKNFGSTSQNNFNVHMNINSVPAYSQNVMITTPLAAGATTQVTFPAWTATVGSYSATTHTFLTGDANAANDSLQKNLGVFASLTSAFCFKNNTQPSKFYLEAPDAGFSDMGSITAWYSRGGSYIAVSPGVYKWYVLGADFNLVSMDTLTGVPTLIGPTGVPAVGTYFLPGLTYDKTTSTLYAGYITGTYPGFVFSLYTINQTTGAATLVAASATAGTFFDLACNAAGQLYAIEHRQSLTGRLWSINKTTAVMTLIGTDLGGACSSNFQDMEFAPNGGLYYAASNSGDGLFDGLYTINTTTGLATLIGTFPVAATQIVGLGIKDIDPVYVGLDNVTSTTQSVSVFPNPATDLISVVSNNNEPIRTLKVFSVSGQLVYTENVDFIATTLNTSNYQDGYYFVVVSTDKGTSTSKFVVAR